MLSGTTSFVIFGLFSLRLVQYRTKMSFWRVTYSLKCLRVTVGEFETLLQRRRPLADSALWIALVSYSVILIRFKGWYNIQNGCGQNFDAVVGVEIIFQ